MAQIDRIRNLVRGTCEAVIVDRCGHSPYRQFPDQTLAAMTSFIRNLL